MTVVFIGDIRNFVGVSGDSKPTDAPAGSTFFETNTRASYVYDGTAWQLKVREEL